MSEQNLVQCFVERFRDQHTITVATGVTCAYLGDERNLREYLVADEIVRALRAEGHIVHFLCFDDDIDPLNYRQLRVAVDKKPELVTRFEPYCGRPISDIRGPVNAETSWSQHFEQRFINRLSSLGCHPNLISVSRMYERGLMTPYVKQVLLGQDQIRNYLHNKFPQYHPEKLFWAICPTCGYIDGTQVGQVDEAGVEIICQRCLCTTKVAFEELRGKLNWKLDCAARWAIFNVDAEPFSKAYLEPHSGSYHVAQRLSKTFFNGPDVSPIHYGTVTMPTSLGCRILECLPSNVVRSLFVRHPKSDLDITEERLATEANKVEVLPDLTFANLVKQLLPIWLLDSSELTADQRELMSKGIAYSRQFEKHIARAFLPNRGHLEDVPAEILQHIQGVIQQVMVLRKAFGSDYEAFCGPAKAIIERLGVQRSKVTMHFRKIIGQEQGVPNSRFLFLLPMSYLMNLESLIDLYIGSKARDNKIEYAVIQQESAPPTLKAVSGDIVGV